MIRRPPRSTLFPYTSSSDLLVRSVGALACEFHCAWSNVLFSYECLSTSRHRWLHLAAVPMPFLIGTGGESLGRFRVTWDVVLYGTRCEATYGQTEGDSTHRSAIRTSEPADRRAHVWTPVTSRSRMPSSAWKKKKQKKKTHKKKNKKHIKKKKNKTTPYDTELDHQSVH